MIIIAEEGVGIVRLNFKQGLRTRGAAGWSPPQILSWIEVKPTLSNDLGLLLAQPVFFCKFVYEMPTLI
jgi:hypothetical protein